MKSLFQLKSYTYTFAFLAMSSLLLSGCISPNTSTPTPSGQAANKPQPGTTPTPTATVSPGAQFGISQVSKVIMNLGSTKIFQFGVTGSPGFSGSVSLSIERNALNLADPAQYVTISLNPTVVSLSGGSTAQVQATVTTNTLAPDFNASFRILGVQTGITGAVAVSSNVSFQIMPIYEMRMLGGAAPEAWSGPTPLNLRANSAGVTVQFVNYDAALAHVVHSSGAIPHGNVGAPLTRAVNGTPQAGGTYSYLVPKGTAAARADYYCHLHENAGLRRVINFNVGAAAATFTSIKANILNTKCLSCHQNTATGAGGVSFANYTDTRANVVPSSAATSLLHQSIVGGSMPPVGSAQLTAAEKLAIMDWISNGALNN